jgi:hypothetical protein
MLSHIFENHRIRSESNFGVFQQLLQIQMNLFDQFSQSIGFRVHSRHGYKKDNKKKKKKKEKKLRSTTPASLTTAQSWTVFQQFLANLTPQ